MNGTRTHYARTQTRQCFVFCLGALLTLTACGGEQLLGPDPAAILAIRGPAVTVQTVAVGDEVLLWTSWSIPEGSAIAVIVTGRNELADAPSCPPVSYHYDATIQQKFASGNTQASGAGKLLQSAAVLQPGTRLRFSRWVTFCEDGSYSAYAFEVISVPGKN